MTIPPNDRPPGVAFEALPPIDAVVLSHDHYDHLDAPTIRRVVAGHPAARWLAPLGVAARLTALGVPASSITERDWWGTARVGPLAATCVPAQHFSGRGVDDRNRTFWCGWVLRVGTAGRALYFADDRALHPDFAEVTRRCGAMALALLPIGAYARRWFMRPVHCDPDDALAADDTRDARRATRV